MSTAEVEKKSQNSSPSKTQREESKNLSIKNSSIYNPELLSKRNVIINTSTSKAMYSFSTARRFKPTLRDESQFFYNISAGLNKRGTSLGYGKKISFSNQSISPGPGEYNYIKLNIKGRYPKSEFPNSPQSKFGSAIRFRTERVISDTPGPSTYNLESMIKGNGIIYNSRYNSNLGKSMGLKLGELGKTIVSPGPGSYDYMKMNLKGKYPSSILSNSVISSFGNEKRFRKEKDEAYPAPNAYKLEDMIKGNGIMYSSKYNSNLGKTIGMKFNTTSKYVTPGPGAYEFFSDFEGFYKYGKNKKYNNTKVDDEVKSSTETQKDKESKVEDKEKSN